MKITPHEENLRLSFLITIEGRKEGIRQSQIQRACPDEGRDTLRRLQILVRKKWLIKDDGDVTDPLYLISPQGTHHIEETLNALERGSYAGAQLRRRRQEYQKGNISISAPFYLN